LLLWIGAGLISLSACLVGCLYWSFIRSDTIHITHTKPQLDISPSGKTIAIAYREKRNDALLVFRYPFSAAEKVVQVSGNIVEVCLLNDNQAVVSVRKRRDRRSSERYVYLVKLDTGTMRRITSETRIWEANILRVSEDKFIFRQYSIQIYPNPLGWEIYGLEKSALIFDTGSEETIPLTSNIDYIFSIVQILRDKRFVVLSCYTHQSKRWLLAELDKPIDYSDARIVRRHHLPIYSESLIADENGRFFFYLVNDPDKNTYEIHCLDRERNETNRIVVFNNRIEQMRCIGKTLFFLTDSGYESLWRIRLDGTELRRVADIRDFVSDMP
jgi:protease II